MGGIKAFLTKTGPFGLPVYAYVGGALALIGGIWYFKTHASSSTANAAATAPQTNYPTVAMPPGGSAGGPVPLPFPTGDPSPVPPTQAFTTPPAQPSLMGATVNSMGQLDLTNFTGDIRDMQNIMNSLGMGGTSSSTGSANLPVPSTRYISPSPAPTSSQQFASNSGIALNRDRIGSQGYSGIQFGRAGIGMKG